MGFRFWRRKNSRSKHAEKNNRKLMKELIKSFDGKYNPIRTFTEKELSKATLNYDPDLLIRLDFFDLYRVGELYTGELGATKDWPILIKKLRYFSDEYRERVINEVVVLSQMKHKHVVKLLGCCLETQLPILVYESSQFHKTLSDLIINDHPTNSPLSWESRLRIVTEIADAITYMHTFSSRPIIHRDIHLGNIFLDHQDVARLFGFFLCIRIPDGQTHVQEPVLGTLGYIDPTYVETSQTSEKADVYSFGGVLFEILLGKSSFHIIRGIHEGEYGGFESLIETSNGDFESLMRGLIAQDRHLLRQLVDPTITRVAKQMSDQQLEAYANLIVRCTYTKEYERPEMIEVAKELRRIWKTTLV